MANYWNYGYLDPTLKNYYSPLFQTKFYNEKKEEKKMNTTTILVKKEDGQPGPNDKRPMDYIESRYIDDIIWWRRGNGNPEVEHGYHEGLIKDRHYRVDNTTTPVVVIPDLPPVTVTITTRQTVTLNENFKHVGGTTVPVGTVGWKKVMYTPNPRFPKQKVFAIAKLLVVEKGLVPIPNAVLRKFRAPAVKVLKQWLLGSDGVSLGKEVKVTHSHHSTNLTYTTGRVVRSDMFTEDVYNDCGHGIHMLPDVQSAIKWTF